jgi:predicted nucleic acid-binding protein
MILVDSSVIMDVFGHDPEWEDWSAEHIEYWGNREQLAVNPLVYAELSVGFDSAEELDDDLTQSGFVKLELPYDAAYLAGRTYLIYRRRGGQRRSPLADFYIGAHAQTAGIRLLTRDVSRYRTYFPRLRLIAPE